MDYLDITLKQNSKAIVVAFDICSSSDIVEKLIARGELGRYVKLLEKIKHQLAGIQLNNPFVLYKFTGDGWILLFPIEDDEGHSIDGRVVLDFMHNLSVWFKRAFRELVAKYLDMPPSITGITFGVDVGRLHRMTMYQRKEYIGRAIVVACRLQQAIKDRDKSPGYKALVTRSVFNDHLSPATAFNVRNVSRKLWNIGGGAIFRCKKIKLLK
jgi:hypothetical protein